MVSWDLGGAEIRFFEIFRRSQKTKWPFSIIMPQSLFLKLQGRYKDLDKNNKNIFIYDHKRNNKISVLYGYIRILSKFKEKCSVHYPLNFLWPLHLLRNDTLSCSVVDPGYPKNRKIIYRLFDFIGLCIFAKKIDVLNPAIYRKLLKIPCLRKKLFLTPHGSFYDSEAPLSSLSNRLILLIYGRFIKMKGILEVLENYIALARNLQKTSKMNFELIVAGYGPLEQKIYNLIAKIKNQGYKTKLLIRPKLKNVFRHNLILISNQRDSNYPSRVCVESLARGCPILISCSGDSKAFGRNKPGIYYFKDINDTKKLAQRIIDIKNQTSLEFTKKIQKTANKTFSSNKTVYYYKNILT